MFVIIIIVIIIIVVFVFPLQGSFSGPTGMLLSLASRRHQ